MYVQAEHERYGRCPRAKLVVKMTKGLNHLAVSALILLTGCASWTKVPVTTCVPETKPTLAELANYGWDVVEEVDTWPTVIGGLESAQQRLRIPELARRAKISGRVVVSFVVDEEGRVRNPLAIECLGGGLDEEAKRVLRTLRFTPGMKDGKPVPVRLQLPFTIRIYG